MKTKIFFLLLMLVGHYLGLQAAFLENVPQRLTQPDGRIVNCFATGDEYYHWLHDENGFTIIQSRETGFFVYAAKSGDELIPTDLQPGRDNPSSAGLVPRLNISEQRYRELFQTKYKEPGYKAARTYSNTGNYNNLVIFIRFSNQPEYSESLTKYSSAFNGTGTVSMTEYFKEVSKTQLNIQTTFYPNPSGTTIVSYQDSHSRRYYQPYSSSNTEGYRTDNQSVEREMTLLKNASESVASQVIASGINYDHDNDGNIDNVCFIIQGPTDGWSDLLWPHRWVLYLYDVRIGGKRVYDFNFQLSEALGVSVLCHEMFHSLGAPDLYRYVNNDITPVGPWDLMAHNKTPPQHMSAYMKMKYGKWFNEIPVISSGGTYSLKPLSSDGYAAYKIPSPNSTTEFFVVEYRRATGRFESSLVGSGLIIYRINQSLDGNAQGPPDEVYVYRQGGNNRTDGNINNATFSSSVGRTAFGDNTSPSDFLSSGAPGGISITNIGAIGETISFTVGTVSTFNPPTDLMATLTGRDVELTWKKPEAGNGTLSGYKVFRNGLLVNTIGNPNTLTFTQTGLSDGSYQYHVTATYTNPAGESGPSNIVAVNVSAEQKPDLIITEPAVEPTNVEPGLTVKLSCKLENRGSATAVASTLRVYLSLDETFDSSDRQLASGAMDPLDPNAVVEVSGDGITIPATTPVGNWFVLYVADADGNVAESIENNNEATAPLSVGNMALNPPRNLTASVSGSSVNLSWNKPEEGGGTLSGYTVFRNSVKVSFIADPEVLEYTDTGLQVGTYTYYLTATYSDPEGESPRSNMVQVTLANESKPDLTIQDFIVTPAVLAPGGTLKMSCTLLNLGGAEAPSNLVQLYLSKDEVLDANDILLAYGTMDPLSAGDEVAISGEDIPIPAGTASGSWYTLVIADANYEIPETNENNNLASASIVVQGEAADLQIIGLTFYPKVIIQKTNFRVTSTLYNGGNATASPVKVSLYLSFDEILDNADIKLFDESTRVLGSKGTIQLSDGFTLSSSITPGQYFLIGIVDPDGSVSESDEQNNTIVQSVVVAVTSGTDDFTLATGLCVYPNPAKDVVHLDINDVNSNDARIEVFNPQGVVVYSSKIFFSVNNQTTIDVSRWSPGCYFLRYISKSGILKEILIVQ